MGLINLYNAMSMVPHIPYRFKAEIWPNHDGQYIPNANNVGIEFAVKRISQPTFKMNTENKKVFGNTAHVVPILKFGETTMEITFEENDDMLVFKTLAGYMGNELYTGIPGGLINIRITQFDNSMNIIVDKRVYVCRLKEHGMPSFNNNGFGSPVEISATFNVIYVIEEPVVIDTAIDEDGKVTVNRDKLPDNETVELELLKVVEEEVKKKKEEEERERILSGGRTKEMRKRIREAKERMDKKRDELSEAIQRQLYISHSSSNMDRQNYFLDAAKEKFLKIWASARRLDVNVLNADEKYAAKQEYDKLSFGEKLMLAYEIDLSDGLDDNEITTIENELLNSIGNGVLTENDFAVIAKNINKLAKEYGEAHKDYVTELNKPVPVGSNLRNGDPIRYKQYAETNAAAVDNLDAAIEARKVTDANGNQITSAKELIDSGKYFVDGHQYKARFYGKKWSLNSDISGNDYSYERAAANPEEVFQNVTANGPIPYNLGGKSDGNINDGLDCMGFIGIVTQATGADVVDVNGNKLEYNKVKKVFADNNVANFFNKNYRVVVPPGNTMRVFAAKDPDGSGHIYVEYDGYIYESVSNRGVIKTEKSKWNAKGRTYKDVTASEEQVAQFLRSTKNKTS